MYSFEDLSIFFTDFAVSLTWNGKTISCLFGEKSDPLAFQAGGRDISAVVRSSEAIAMSQGDTLTIEGKSYAIAEIQPIQDGQTTKLLLEAVG